MSKITRVLFTLTDILAWLLIASGVISLGYLLFMDEAEMSFLTERMGNWGLGAQVVLVSIQSVGFYLFIRRKVIGLAVAIASSVALSLPIQSPESLIYLLLFVFVFTLPWGLSYFQLSKEAPPS